MASFLPFLFLSLLFLASLTLLFKKIKHWNAKIPPSPPKLPIIGNLHQIGSLPHQSLHQLSKKFGPVMLIQLGLNPMVVISSAESAKEVLKTHDLQCCSRPALHGTRKLTRNYKDIAFAPYSERWRNLRKLAVLELFSVKKVQSFRYIREEEVGFLVKTVSESALKNVSVDLSKTLFELTASIIFRVAFGQNFHESKFMDKERIQEIVTEAENLLASLTASDFFAAGIGWTIDWLFGLHKKLHEIFVEFDRFFQNVIDDHLKNGKLRKDSRDIVGVLLNLIEEQDGNYAFQLTVDNIKGVLLNIFLAGIDTSAITTIWAMSELIKNPKLMKKAQSEIRNRPGKPNQNKIITEDEIQNFNYLQMIIKETFRLHPAAPLLLPRETMSKIKIQGYEIPAKTRLQINVWAIGRDPEIWENAEEFIPERFEDSDLDYRGQDFEFLPFGSGRRSCPGISMGVATVEVALANLLYFFDWKLPEGMAEKDLDMEEEGSLTINKKVPLELVPVLYR